MMRRILCFLVLAAGACSDSSDPTAPGTGGTTGTGASGGNAGSGGSSGVGGSGGSSGVGGSGGGTGGSTCTSVTGSYALTGTRDSAAPGSCSNSISYTGRIVELSTNTAGYALDIRGNGTIYPDSLSCTVNVTGCTLNGTCNVIDGSTYNSETAFSITQNGLAGTDKWSNYMQSGAPACTANWNVVGTRQ